MSAKADSAARRGGHVVIVGSGGFAHEASQAVYAPNECGVEWRLLGYIDDDPARRGTLADGKPNPAERDELPHLPDASGVVCTGRLGNSFGRILIVGQLGLPSSRYATIVHLTAAVSSSPSIWPDGVLLAHVTLWAAVRVTAHVAIMQHVRRTHDDVIADFATIASWASLGSGVGVEWAACLGASVLVGEYQHVCAGALVIMGAVASHDVSLREVRVGVQAPSLRSENILKEFTEESP